MYDMILIRYGEMTLKKQNYRQFLRKVNDNIKNKCKHLEKLNFQNTNYRFYIYLNGESHQEVIDILDTVVGLSSYSLCKKTTNNIEEIAKVAIDIINDNRPSNNFTFKVETHRGNKDYPLTSIEISQNVARLIIPNIQGMTVDVHNPDLTLSIDLRNEGTYIYTQSIKGLGGYPSGMAGKGLLMLSGGIDSPVAGYLAIRKGVVVNAIHFASPPYTSDMALQKAIDLLERLAAYSSDGKINLYVVGFTDIQNAIRYNANSDYIITLMRRAMYRISSRFASNNKYDCIINGESIGQVASQTLESIKVVNDVTNFPIIRPLATYDKDDIIKLSRQIKTYDISIRPYEDCCTVFVPEHPVIKPDLQKVLIEENKCNLDKLLEGAYQSITKYELSTDNKFVLFSNQDKFTI